jgi:hypothetical protein
MAKSHILGFQRIGANPCCGQQAAACEMKIRHLS